MAEIRSFRAIRPRKELTARIAALPYDVYNSKEARKEVEREPLSFLKIDRAETQLGEEVDHYSQEVYEKARETLLSMEQEGVFQKEEKPCLYLYEETMDGHVQTGLVCCASIDDYLNGVIKKHENTRRDKEEDRVRHVDVLNTQTGPIFLAYRRVEELSELFSKIKEGETLFDFESAQQVRQRGWKIGEEAVILRIREIFRKIPALYIADGHHRAASAVRVGMMRREAAKSYTGEEEFNFFLSVLFPAEELRIFDYNRVLLGLNGNTEKEFMKKLSEKFKIQKQQAPVRPEKKGVFGMYTKEGWYRLETLPKYQKDDPVEGLDVSYLQREVLAPLIGIKDPKTDRRIDFVGGIRGLAELERRVKEGAKAAFSLYPTSMEELFEVADAGALMPPKSTWFEPKLLSGLFLHELV